MTPTIKPCTEERYDEMLGVLPPTIMDGKGFMVGEPWNHRQCTVTGKYGQPTFAAFFQLGDRYFEAEKPMTIGEYNAITPIMFRDLVRSSDRAPPATKQQEPQP